MYFSTKTTYFAPLDRHSIPNEPAPENKSKIRQSYIAKTDAIELKVLVAEDNNLNALLIKKLFKKWKIITSPKHSME